MMNISVLVAILAVLAGVSFVSKPQLTEEEARDRITLYSYRSKK